MKKIILIAIFTTLLTASYEEFIPPCRDGEAFDTELHKCVDINTTIAKELQDIADGEE